MRDLKRNQQNILCSLLNVTADTDEWGNTTNVKSYGEPQALKMNVSADRGTSSAEGFGTHIQYDREMSTHDMSCPIDEFTRLWLDGRLATETHNYEVAAISKSLNCIRYAIRMVNVS